MVGGVFLVAGLQGFPGGDDFVAGVVEDGADDVDADAGALPYPDLLDVFFVLPPVEELFGGDGLAVAERFEDIVEIALALAHDVVVVVFALGGVGFVVREQFADDLGDAPRGYLDDLLGHEAPPVGGDAAAHHDLHGRSHHLADPDG